MNTGYEGFTSNIGIYDCWSSVITTAVGGNKDLYNKEKMVFMSKYQDEFNLVEAVKSLWQNQNYRRNLKKKAKRQPNASVPKNV